MIKDAIAKLYKKENLTKDEAYACMDEIMSEGTSQIQMAGYLTALSLKGETIDEIVGSARGMRDHCQRLLDEEDALEIVGTGGDGSNSFNISTTSAIVIAAGGVKVAKHGNRAASSRSGAADCLEALGVNIQSTPEKAKQLLNDINICFLFAQNYHLAMKYVAPVRKDLGIPTVFNILGPLTNPAGATKQVMGVYSKDLIEPLAQVLTNLGVKHAMVVYNDQGFDEITTCGDTYVCEVKDGDFTSYVLKPEDYGFDRCARTALVGGSPEDNARVTISVLRGDKNPRRDTVLMNAGAGLYVGGAAASIKDGIAMAAELIDSGKAMAKLEEFKQASQDKEEDEDK